MNLKRIINGIIIFMIFIMQMASQHLASRQELKRELIYDNDNDHGNSELEQYYAPYQKIKQKQKFITTTGNNGKAPSKIAFDTYNMFGYTPSLLKGLRRENKYSPIKRQNQLLQQQQQSATSTKDKRYEKLSQQRQRQRQQMGQLSSEFKPINDNGNKFDDALYPFDNTANDAAEDQNDNDNDNLPLPSSSLQQLPLLQLLGANNYENDDKAAEKILNYLLMPETSGDDELLDEIPIDNTDKNYFDYNDSELSMQTHSLDPTKDDHYTASKQNAFHAFKRQKAKPQQTPFLPSISSGAMTNLGHFFTDLTNNVQFFENRRLSSGEEQLLEGDHPITMLKDELMRSVDGNPNGRFLNAIRTYQPSQKIRSLVAMNPEGYHGTQFIDPNYYYLGLG